MKIAPNLIIKRSPQISTLHHTSDRPPNQQQQTAIAPNLNQIAIAK
ncbi:hypothetical protein V2H45_03365 [Tumidithrix elongata RA019]|uniref:Uncharacterized protein n=1 Tax=Tumidithrix elongata BACA0141 TaxID=2716417 RepID=A0AAW9PZ81_9CYAN|nr:hypothetical protein [Tumidithrix elongata RA019]